MVTIRQIREVTELHRVNRKGKLVPGGGMWHDWMVAGRFGIYFAWFFIVLGFNANTVTFLMIVAALVGTGLCIPHFLWMNILGAIFLWLFIVLDYTDGQVARWNKKSSFKGVYLDLASHVFCDHTMKIACACHLYLLTSEVKYLLLAFITYGASISKQGIQRWCYDYLHRNFSEKFKTQQETGKAGISVKAFLLRRFWGILSIPVDNLSAGVIRSIVIFISYSGYYIPMIYMSWLFAAFEVFWLLVTVMKHYFIMLPNAPHIKIGSADDLARKLKENTEEQDKVSFFQNC